MKKSTILVLVVFVGVVRLFDYSADCVAKGLPPAFYSDPDGRALCCFRLPNESPTCDPHYCIRDCSYCYYQCQPYLPDPNPCTGRPNGYYGWGECGCPIRVCVNSGPPESVQALELHVSDYVHDQACIQRFNLSTALINHNEDIFCAKNSIVYSGPGSSGDCARFCNSYYLWYPSLSKCVCLDVEVYDGCPMGCDQYGAICTWLGCMCGTDLCPKCETRNCDASYNINSWNLNTVNTFVSLKEFNIHCATFMGFDTPVCIQSGLTITVQVHFAIDVAGTIYCGKCNSQPEPFTLTVPLVTTYSITLAVEDLCDVIPFDPKVMDLGLILCFLFEVKDITTRVVEALGFTVLFPLYVRKSLESAANDRCGSNCASDSLLDVVKKAFQKNAPPIFQLPFDNTNKRLTTIPECFDNNCTMFSPYSPHILYSIIINTLNDEGLNYTELDLGQVLADVANFSNIPSSDIFFLSFIFASEDIVDTEIIIAYVTNKSSSNIELLTGRLISNNIFIKRVINKNGQYIIPICGDGILHDLEVCDDKFNELSNSDFNPCVNCQLLDGWLCDRENGTCVELTYPATTSDIITTTNTITTITEFLETTTLGSDLIGTTITGSTVGVSTTDTSPGTTSGQVGTANSTTSTITSAESTTTATKEFQTDVSSAIFVQFEISYCVLLLVTLMFSYNPFL